MGNIKSHEQYDHRDAARSTLCDNEGPPLGYPTIENRARQDPFLRLLKGFTQIYLQGKEAIERQFPGACDGFLDFLNKTALLELVPKHKNRACMQRSLSMSSVHDNERFKVRDLDIDGDLPPPVHG